MDELIAAENAFGALNAIGQVPALAFANGSLSTDQSGRSPATAPAVVSVKSLGSFDSSAYMTESELAEEMKSLRETNEKIMQQNIALLADVEAMTEQLTRMRNEKAILASKIVQLSQ